MVREGGGGGREESLHLLGAGEGGPLASLHLLSRVGVGDVGGRGEVGAESRGSLRVYQEGRLSLSRDLWTLAWAVGLPGTWGKAENYHKFGQTSNIGLVGGWDSM